MGMGGRDACAGKGMREGQESVVEAVTRTRGSRQPERVKTSSAGSPSSLPSSQTTPAPLPDISSPVLSHPPLARHLPSPSGPSLTSPRQPERALSPIPMPLYLSYASMSPIHSLPVELLTTIFQLGVDSDPIPDDQVRGEHTFEVLVSHVCRHWRHVALHTPHLWTTVHFRTLAHMARGEVYLARNAHLPIDIYVDTCSEDDYHLRKDLLFREQFLAVFNVVLPQIHRWRELHLIVADLECKSFARQVLSKCGTAPALRTLQLWHVMNWQTSERLFNHIGPPPVVVFGGALPSLKHIILQGVNLPWSRSPFLCNLTSVEFALHSDNVRMPFALWRDMLRASPALTRLSLLFAGPRASSSGTSPAPDGIEWWGAAPPPPDAVLPPGAPLPPSTDPVQLLQLREVQLNNLEADYLIALFRTLHAPAVRSLHLGLDFDDQDFTPFIEYLAAPPGPHKLETAAGTGTARPQPKFPVLESLSVSALRCTVQSWRALLAVSPKLTRLEADFTQLSEHAFDVLLETVTEPQATGSQHPPSPSESAGEGKGSAAETAKTVPMLPKLESVRVSGAEGKQLAEFAAFRRTHGCRIRRWEIEEGARDEHSEALERDAAAESAALLARRDAEDREAGRACEPWRWDEPLEKVVWFREEEDGEESEFDDGEEGYAEEEDAEGDGDGEEGGE